MLALVVPGIGIEAGPTGEISAQPGQATLNVVHASPDAPPIHVLVNGAALLRDVAPGGVATASVPSGAATLQVTAQADASRVLLTAPLDLAAGRMATVVLAGRVGGEPALRAVVVADSPTGPPPGRVRLRFLNVAAGAMPHSLATADGTQLTDAVAFGASGEVEMDGGALSLRAVPTAGDAVAGAATTLTARGGTHLLVLTGPSGGATAPALVVVSPAVATRSGPVMRGPVGPGEVLIEETFDDPAIGLLPASAPPTSDLIYGYADGEYSLRNLEVATQSLPIPGSPENATIAVDARLIGPTTQRTVSVGCRFTSEGPNNRGYRLRVEPGAGMFRLVREDGARDFILRRDQVNAAIKRGNEVNRLELTCAGTTITAAINGVTVATVEDRTYRAGPLVIGVGARADGLTSEARFDNLVVTQR